MSNWLQNMSLLASFVPVTYKLLKVLVWKILYIRMIKNIIYS